MEISDLVLDMNSLRRMCRLAAIMMAVLPGALYSEPPSLSDKDARLLQAMEKKIGRELTEAELKLRPEGAGIYSWVMFLELHRIQVQKNGLVEFFGRVVSAEGAPLEGVAIDVEVRYYLESLTEKLKTEKVGGSNTFQVLTDKNGCFHICHGIGSFLIVSGFQKAEWVLSGEKTGWGFIFVPESPTRHIADPEDPIRFVMEKAVP